MRQNTVIHIYVHVPCVTKQRTTTTSETRAVQANAAGKLIYPLPPFLKRQAGSAVQCSWHAPMAGRQACARCVPTAMRSRAVCIQGRRRDGSQRVQQRSSLSCHRKMCMPPPSQVLSSSKCKCVAKHVHGTGTTGKPTYRAAWALKQHPTTAGTLPAPRRGRSPGQRKHNAPRHRSPPAPRLRLRRLLTHAAAP